jgi:hypothetical protein
MVLSRLKDGHAGHAHLWYIGWQELMNGLLTDGWPVIHVPAPV